MHLSRAGEIFDAFRIAFFDAAEALAAVGERDLVAGLTGESHGRFDRAVAASDDQNSFIDVVIGFNEAVHHLGQILALHAEFARFSSAAERQNHGPRAILVGGCDDRENAVFIFRDVFDFFSGGDVEVGTVQNHVPEGQQVFFRELHLLELAVHGEFNRAGHHQLLPGILCDGTTDFVALESEVIELVLDGAERGADARWSRTDDQNVVDSGDGLRRAVLLEASGNRVDDNPGPDSQRS